MTDAPTALIAEDEPLLAAALQAELARAWPELRVVASVGDGHSAVTQALQCLPDVLFLDIQMPGLSGLDAAVELADAWPTAPGSKPFPALVFVTAFDHYAVQAFEAQAVDYLLKPVQPARLQKTVSKVALTLAMQAQSATKEITPSAHLGPALQTTLDQLRALLAPIAPQPAMPRLSQIQVSVGGAIRMVPLQEVIYFEAADKYVRVLTVQHEYLIRTPLKELLPQLDADVFWRIHRGTVVNVRCIDTISRDEAGKLSLSLKGHADKLIVSRLYAGLFKAM